MCQAGLNTSVLNWHQEKRIDEIAWDNTMQTELRNIQET